MTMSKLVLAVSVGVLLSGCNSTAGDDGGTGGGVAMGGGAATGGGASGTGGGGQVCSPLTCASANASCGTVSDGCGGTLSCGACACTATTFATDCPSRPCETATGCTNNACVYEPVTCGFEQCTGCVPGADGGCADSSVRACGGGCATNYCDPSQSLVGGKPVFANTCRPRTDLRCGTCNLGGLSCGADAGVASCNAPVIPDVNPALIECNGGSPSATILFVQPDSTVGMHDGSKEFPFLSLDEALAAAATRGSRAVIIGGSPTINAPLTLANGVSILGGFTGAPTWVLDDTRRPVFTAPISAAANGRLVGLVANTISAVTVLSNVDVVVPSVVSSGGPGLSTVGAQLINASNLTLVNVHFVVGDAQAGAAGTPAGAADGTVPPSANGASARLFTGNSPACLRSGFTTTLGAAAVAPTCGGVLDSAGLGGNGANTFVSANTGQPAGFSRGFDAPTGAAGGLASSMNTTLIPGPGQPGAPWTTVASPGMAGTASLSWVANLPVALGRGGDGVRGAPGRGGGGGSSGYSSEAAGQNSNTCYVGGSGGAGGAGGCGGLGGAGGAPGGWTLGLALSGSSAPRLINVTVQLGRGGDGGSGGHGGDGLAGAVGGAGGVQGSVPFQPYLGSSGGTGARGQTGGTGGPGASGQARGVVCAPGLRTSTSSVSSSSTDPGFVAVEGC